MQSTQQLHPDLANWYGFSDSKSMGFSISSGSQVCATWRPRFSGEAGLEPSEDSAAEPSGVSRVAPSISEKMGHLRWLLNVSEGAPSMALFFSDISHQPHSS